MKPYMQKESIKIQTQSQPYGCSHCGKRYTRKLSLERHKHICDLLHQTKRETALQQEEEDNITLPTQKQMFHIIEELAFHLHRLEDKIEKMQPLLQKNKKKIYILPWLQEQPAPAYIFDDIHANLKIQTHHIETLIHHSLASCLTQIFQDNADIFQPMYCCTQKNNTFYICTKLEPCTWVEYPKQNIMCWFDILQRIILKKLREWKTENQALLDENDAVAAQYHKSIIHLMVSLRDDAELNKWKYILFHIFKKDLKQIVETSVEC